MMKRILLLLVVLALAALAAQTYQVTLIRPSVVAGKDMKAGEYKLNLNGATAALVAGKKSVEIPVRMESAEKKFERTQVLYKSENGKLTVKAIELGGSTTRLVIDTPVKSATAQ